MSFDFVAALASTRKRGPRQTLALGETRDERKELDTLKADFVLALTGQKKSPKPEIVETLLTIARETLAVVDGMTEEEAGNFIMETAETAARSFLKNRPETTAATREKPKGMAELIRARLAGK